MFSLSNIAVMAALRRQPLELQSQHNAAPVWTQHFVPFLESVVLLKRNNPALVVGKAFGPIIQSYCPFVPKISTTFVSVLLG